jgi:hypothetical protein
MKANTAARIPPRSAFASTPANPPATPAIPRCCGKLSLNCDMPKPIPAAAPINNAMNQSI